MNNLSLAPKIDTPNFLENIASNKYFIGIIMIVMNIGARFLIDELTPEQKKMVNTQNFRRFIIFCAFFAATRDLLSAVTLTIIFILFISEIFTDEEDIKNKKKGKITPTDIQNELNSLINKVKMMQDGKGENEEKEIVEKEIIVENKFILVKSKAHILQAVLIKKNEFYLIYYGCFNAITKLDCFNSRSLVI